MTALLLDLDGTLLDTAPDFVVTLNTLLSSRNMPPLTENQVRNVVSQGTKAMLKLAFGIETTSPDYPQLSHEFLEIYQQNLTTLTRPYPGIDLILKACAEKNIRWGIVTNKPRYLTVPLVEFMRFQPAAACIVAGDDVTNKKPDPESLIKACQLLDCSTQQCIYVGDAQADIIAGQKAGMTTIVAEYGYIADSINVKSWNADGYIREANELSKWLVKLTTDIL